MPDDGQPEWLARLGCELGQGEGLSVRLAAGGIEGGRHDHAALPVEVADQHVQVHQSRDVVEPVGVLGRAPVHVHARLLAVGGELHGHVLDDLGRAAADLRPLGDGLLLGGFQHDLERGLHLDGLLAALQGRAVHEQFARDGFLLIIGIEGDRLAVLQGHQILEGVFLSVLVLPHLLGLEADVRGPQERAGGAILLQLHQPCTVGPGGLLVRGGGGLVAGSQILRVVPLVLQDPADHALGEGGVGAGLHGDPAAPLRGQLGEAGIHHGDLQLAVRHALGHAGRAVGGAVVSVEEVGPHEQHELGVLQIHLPVELLAVLEGVAHILLADGLGGEVERALADGRMAVGVGSAVGGGEAGSEVGTTALLPTPHVDELVVLGSEVRVLRVDQVMQVGRVLGLELSHRHLLLPDQLHVIAHGGEDLGIPQAPDLLQARHHAVFFAGDMGEEFAAVGDLVHGLIEGNGLPLAIATLAIALQHLADAPGIVGARVARLALGADPRVHPRRPVERFGHGQVGVQGKGAVGTAVDLHGHAVDDLHLDATAGVAVQAGGVEHVLGHAQFVEFLFAELPAFGLGDEVLGEGHLRGREGAASSDGTEIHEPTAGHPLLGLKGCRQLLSHRSPPDSCPRCSGHGASSPSSP